MLISVFSLLLVFGSAFAADSSKVKEKASETANAASDYARETKSDFELSMKKQLADVQRQIDALKERAVSASGTAQESVARQIGDLNKQRTFLAKRLDETAKTSGTAWKEMKAGLAKAMDDLKSGYRKAKATVSGEGDDAKTR